MAKFEDRENRRKKSVVGSLVDPVPEAPRTGKGRPKANRETKRRVSLSVLPSLYEDVQKIAFVQRRSTSEVLGELMERFREEHQGELAQYTELDVSAP